MTVGDGLVVMAAAGAATVLIVTGNGVWVIGVVLAAMFLLT